MNDEVIRLLCESLSEAIRIRKMSIHRECNCGPIHICNARALIATDPHLIRWQEAYDRATQQRNLPHEKVDEQVDGNIRCMV